MTTVRHISSPHVENVSASIEFGKDGNIERVLTVETGLQLDATAPDYDEEAERQLLDAIAASLGDLYDRAILKRRA